MIGIQNLNKDYVMNHRCHVIQSDFNIFIKKLEKNWSNTRGVLFLDPFGAAVNWATMEQISGFKALDTWILHPASTIRRLLPKNKLPDSQPGWADKLDNFFGGNHWRHLYKKNPQQKLIGEPDPLRDEAEFISDLYKKQLRELFQERFLEETYLLKQNNAVLFEFMFCVGNSNGIRVAQKNS